MPNLAGRAVDQDIGRLDVLMDEPALMELAQSRRNTDGEAQEVSHLDGHAEQPIERLAPLIVEHQHGPTAIVHEVQWAHRPCAIELILEFVFVAEAIEA